MRKSFFFMSFIAVTIVSLCIFYVKENTKTIDDKISLESVFKRSGAEIVSSEIYFWGEIGNRFNSIDEVYPIAESIMSTLKIDRNSDYTENRVQNDITQNMLLSGTNSYGESMDIIINISKDASDSNEKYISVNIIKDSSYDSMEDTKEKIENILNSYSIQVRVNTCITGTYDGKVDDIKINEITAGILNKSQAKKIEGIREKNYISVAAYSPQIKTYIKVNGKKVNLNFASRYNSYEDKTYIWLATPVITTEY